MAVLANNRHRCGYGTFSQKLSYLNQGLGLEPFTGKELDAETSLQDFGARYYMAALGRWAQVDPLADEYAGYSPYNYVLGNPNSLIDPDGRAPADCCRRLGGAISRFRSGWDGTVRGLPGALMQTVAHGPRPIIDAVTDPVGTAAGVYDGLNQWAQDFADGDLGDRAEMLGEVGPNLAISLSSQAATGIVYRRVSPSGGVYIGRSNNPGTYLRRQSAHDRAAGVAHGYEVIEYAEPGMALRVAEESAIRRHGGPSGLENKRYEMNESAYRGAGGTVDKPGG